MDPFVSIMTPVYNGEPYISDCIRSVLAQTYTNWEYVVVNNCSTDRTLEVATEFASRDKRIRVVTNKSFVTAIENHNIGFRLISPKSAYCKVVCADDWLEPQCLRKLVDCAEAHPTVGIVGSYQASGENVKWKGLPANVSFLRGREVCRLDLLDGIALTGNPTSVLYRSDLVRLKDPFFPHLYPHADTSACYAHLTRWDFGFVHDVLSHGRVHEGQITTGVNRIGADNVAHLELLLQYGALYLSREELARGFRKALDGYYMWLGASVLKLKGPAFWKFHTSRMRGLGYPLEWRRVLKCAVAKCRLELAHPATALHKLICALKAK